MKATFEVTTTEVGGKTVSLFHNLRFEQGPQDLIIPGSALEKMMSLSAPSTNGKPVVMKRRAPGTGTPRRSRAKVRVPQPGALPNDGFLHGGADKNAPRYGHLGITQDDLERIRHAVHYMDNAISPLQRSILRHYFGVGGAVPTPLKAVAAKIGLEKESWRMTSELRKALVALGIKRKRRRRKHSTRRGGQRGDSSEPGHPNNVRSSYDA